MSQNTLSSKSISSNTITLNGADTLIAADCVTVGYVNSLHTHAISNHAHQSIGYPINDPYWRDGYSPPLPNYQPDFSDIRKKLDELHRKQDEKEKVPMKTLYNVVVVTTKEEILLDKKVVASDADEAKFLADVSEALKEKGLLPKAVTILCTALGQVKVEKEPDKVQLVQA